jgi:NAD(P)-dependent dehydrogenase (short-subunit alcohol dehydrogenase family)
MTNSDQINKDNVVVITGGNSGIGRALVEFYCEKKSLVYSLDLHHRDQNEEIDSQIRKITCDVTDERAMNVAITEISAHVPYISTLFINAGIVPPWSDTANLDIELFDKVLKINVLGAVITLKVATPLMKRPGGSIVFTGSLNSWKGDPNIASYVASKHAILGIVKSAALDLGSAGIRVNAVGPGPIATQALTDRVAERCADDLAAIDQTFEKLRSSTALQRIATVGEVVSAIDFLASENSSGITGQLINVDCGVL